jgi:hypothetical protein
VIPKIAHFHWEGKPIPWLRMMGIWTFARLNPRWEIRLHRTPDHIRERNLPCYANEADWTWIEKLYDAGGFAMPTDTVFIKPIPDEWCEGDLCGCTNGTDRLFHNCIGSVPYTEFLLECIDRCEAMVPDNLDYQAMGTLLLADVVDKMGGPVLWSEPERCWEPDPLPITDETVGVVWYGGHPVSKANEWTALEDHPDAAIVKLALEVCT